jgi:hypothetical protein
MIYDLPKELTCSTCVWASKLNEDGLIECKRYPPELYQGAETPLWIRPLMSQSDGCGEHGEWEE